MPTEETKPKTAKDIVKEYLDNRAATDGLFAKAYAKPAKNINNTTPISASCVKKVDS